MKFIEYFEKLTALPAGIEVSNNHVQMCGLKSSGLWPEMGLAGRTIFFIGNGGSASIASHMAIDYTKNGGFKAMAFNDVSAITCLANDFSYEDIFAKQVETWATASDVLFAISSSGKSPNILKAVEAAKAKGCYVVTLSAFKPDNPLRTMGDVNFYVPTDRYGFAEITHLSILHGILDMAMGL